MKQRFSKRTRLVSALLTLAMVFTFLPFSAFAANTASTEIDKLNFPDSEFRRFLKECYDNRRRWQDQCGYQEYEDSNQLCNQKS